MTAPNYFGWIDTMAELRNEKRKAKQYAAEVGNDISDMDALTLAMALDACMTDPAHILNAETFWVDTEELTAAAYGDADLLAKRRDDLLYALKDEPCTREQANAAIEELAELETKIVDGVSSPAWFEAQEERSL